MKILCITHVDFETPGIIEEWAHTNNYQFSICKPYQGHNCLDLDFDVLIIMGGPQSACELDAYPYLIDEITIIKKALDARKTIIGFCLGAQLIGHALNAPALKSPEKEVGVFPITITREGFSDSLLKDFPQTFNVIHWHNDMPGLTQDACVLAQSAGCPRQIIRYKKNVYGFQCHLEITKDGIETMIKSCPNDFVPSRYTQSPEELLQQDFKTINNYMITILNRLVALSD